MFVTVVLLLAAVGLLIASLGAGHAGLAWGSVALSVVAAVMILRRWRRSWRQRQDSPEDEPIALLDDDEPVETGRGEQPLAPVSATAAPKVDSGPVPAENAQAGDTTNTGDSQTGDTEPGEEDTDAADLLVVYELADEVLVVDEHPRYHVARCRWPDHARVERLPVREARELGFTPCARCRPDTTLARRHRASRTTTGSS